MLNITCLLNVYKDGALWYHIFMESSTQNINNKQIGRQTFLDFLRVIAIFAVVFLHSSVKQYNTSDITTNGFMMANLYDSLVRWAVPVFVMISGTLFLDPQKEITIRMIFNKYIKRIIITFIVWSLVYVIAYNKKATIDSILALIKGHYHLWYLYLIIGLYLCVPILRPIAANRKITEYFLLLALAFTFFVPTVLDVSKMILFHGKDDILKIISAIENVINSKMFLFLVLGYTPYFVLGYYLKNVNISKRLEFFIYALGVIGWISTFILTMQASKIAGKKVNFYSYKYISVLWESIAVYVFAKCRMCLTKEGLFQKVIMVLSSASFGVYLVHVLVLDKMYKFLPLSSLPTPIVVPVLAVITFLISIVISILINKIPCIRKLV